MGEASPQGVFGVALWFLRVVRDGIVLLLQLFDRGLYLRDGGADVGKFDDICSRGLGEVSHPGELVWNFLTLSQLFWKVRNDAAGQ